MDKLGEFEKYQFRNEKIKDTYCHKKYCDIMRTLKEIEVRIDFVPHTCKKLEKIEENLGMIKTIWFENYSGAEKELRMIIGELLRHTY